MYLRPTVLPQLITVAGQKGNAPAPFVMNPGNWTVTIKTNKEVMIVSIHQKCVKSHFQKI